MLGRLMGALDARLYPVDALAVSVAEAQTPEVTADLLATTFAAADGRRHRFDVTECCRRAFLKALDEIASALTWLRLAAEGPAHD